MSYIDLSIHDYLSALSSGKPVPGGGSSGALAGASGAATALMFANLTTGKPSFTQLPLADQKAFQKAVLQLSRVQQTLEQAIDLDTQAYTKVANAYHLPSATAEQQAVRKSVLQEALLYATKIPLKAVQAATDGLAAITVLIPMGNRSALSDGIAGARLLYTSIQIELLNIDANASLLVNDPVAKQYNQQAQEYLHAAQDYLASIQKEADQRI